MSRSEQRIAVVSHSEFLYEMGTLFGQELDYKVRNFLRYDWSNCEMRTFVMTDTSGTLAAADMSLDATVFVPEGSTHAKHAQL